MEQHLSKIYADILIVGGGILGCSIAYHLAATGTKNVLLIEKNALTHGSTWHAAGVVGQLRGSRALSTLAQASVKLYPELEAITGQATGWRRTGSLRLASSAPRMREYRRTATYAKGLGLDVELIDAAAVKELLPILNVDDVQGALYVPDDGVADPSMVTNSLAAGARQNGVQIREGVRVTSIARSGRKITSVTTNIGEIECGMLVNATGLWAREFGLMMDVALPSCSVEHQYIITEAVDGCKASMPSVRDPDLGIYYKPESNGLIVGAWEEKPISFDEFGIRPTFGQELMPPDLDRIMRYLENASWRTPCLDSVGIREVVNGPLPFSPDGEAIVGPIPGLDNAFVVAGCCIGIALGGGLGQAMAEWISTGAPPIDLWPIDVRRFEPAQATRSYMYPRAQEVYHNHYTIGHQWQTVRELRTSPLYPVLREKGAQFGLTGVWEHPQWFAAKDPMAANDEALEADRAVRQEHQAARTGVGLFDLSHLSKFEVSGNDALAVLQDISTADVDVANGTTVRSLFCNERGGIESNLTITRLSDDRFYIVTLAANGARDFDWLDRHTAARPHVELRNITSAWATLLLAGQRAPELLKSLLALEFPTTGGRHTIAGAPVRILPSGFASIDGWELHVPAEFARHLYAQLLTSGASVDLRDCGLKALDIMRIERGTAVWGTDITSDVTPFEAGLGQCVSLEKTSFLGREAILADKARGPKRTLCAFVAEADVALRGSEMLKADGRACGLTTSGCFSYDLDAPIALAYVPAELAAHERFELEAFGETVAAKKMELAELRQTSAARHDAAALLSGR